MNDIIHNYTDTVYKVFSKVALKPFLIFIAALLLSYISHKIINFIFQKQVNRRKYSSGESKKRYVTIIKAIKAAVDIAIWIYATIIFLDSVGVNVASLTTSAGLFGMIIGFGIQNTIRDVIAGVFIVTENQYRVGDNIETQIGGRLISGKVENISLRITQVRDADGKLHTMRNGASEVVTNMSFRYANVNLSFGVDYNTDIDKLERVINEVGEEMAKDESLKRSIMEPIKFLRINQFLDSSMEIKCLGKVRAGKQWEVAGEFRKRIKIAFDKNNINIPYPQLVIRDIKKAPRKISRAKK